MTGRIIIRETDDTDEILRLDALSFTDGSPPTRVDRDRVWLIATALGEPVAYAGLRVVTKAEDREEFCGETGAFLCRAGVLPKWRGLGLQRRLIRRRVEIATRYNLTPFTYVYALNPWSANNLWRERFSAYMPKSLWAGGEVIYFRKES